MLRRRRKQLNELITVKIEPKGWVDHFASHHRTMKIITTQKEKARNMGLTNTCKH